MHLVRDVEYAGGYKLRLRFEDGSLRLVNLEKHLDGEVFEPLKDVKQFRSVRLNTELDTIVWDNGADLSPDFLYEISSPLDEEKLRVAEPREKYGRKPGST